MIREDTQDRLIGWCRQASGLCCRSNASHVVIHSPLTRCPSSVPRAGKPSARSNSQCVPAAISRLSRQRPRPIHRTISANSVRNGCRLFNEPDPLPIPSATVEAICSFKYRGKHTLARPLARLMISALPSGIDVDVIIPVPLHPARLRAREFNQSLLLADQLSRHLARPVSATNLVRIAATDPQTTLTRQARLRNLRKAFEIRRPQDLAEKRILLVDDVFTTGTTLNECAKTLLKPKPGPSLP